MFAVLLSLTLQPARNVTLWKPRHISSLCRQLGGAQVNTFFDMCARHRMALAQPSFRDQYLSHDIVRTRGSEGSLLRFTNFVELQAPVFSRDALHFLRSTLLEPRVACGWGLDYVWPTLLEREAARERRSHGGGSDADIDRVGIVDAVAALHTKPPNAGWAARAHKNQQQTQQQAQPKSFYDSLRIDPEQEMQQTLRKYGLARHRPRPCEDFKRRVSEKQSLTFG